MTAAHWTVLVIAAVWLACGIAAAGIVVAYLQRKYPSIADEFYREDLGLGLGMGLLFGPLALSFALFWSGFAQYGWTLSRRSK